MDGIIKGIRITYSDNSTAEQGHFSGTCKTLDIDVPGGERVTEIEMRGPGDGQWLARLRIKTNHGDELFISKNYCGLFWCEYPTKYELTGDELGEGIILGMIGHEEWHIRCLAFRLLQKATKYELTNVQITNRPPIQLKSLASVVKANPTEEDSVDACSGSTYTFSRRNEVSWSGTSQHVAGVTVSVSYESPKVAKLAMGTVTAEVGAEYQFTRSDTTTETQEHTESETWQLCVAVPKLSKYRYQVYYYQADGDADYTGTMNVHTEGGVWSYGTKGKYKMVSTTKLEEDAVRIAKYVNHEWVPCSGVTCLPPTPKPTMRPTGL